MSLPPPTVRIRTERYISVELYTIPQIKDSDFILSFIYGGNGIPENCFLLRPSSSDNVMMSFRGCNQAWVAIDTTTCVGPNYPITFEIRLDTVPTLIKQDRSVDSTAQFSFTLIYKHGNIIHNIGEYSFNARLMSHKSPVAYLHGSMSMYNDITEEFLNSLPPVPSTDFVKNFIPTSKPKSGQTEYVKPKKGEKGSKKGKKSPTSDEQQTSPSLRESQESLDSSDTHITTTSTTQPPGLPGMPFIPFAKLASPDTRPDKKQRLDTEPAFDPSSFPPPMLPSFTKSLNQSYGIPSLSGNDGKMPPGPDPYLVKHLIQLQEPFNLPPGVPVSQKKRPQKTNQML